MYQFAFPQSFIEIGVVFIILSKQTYYTWIACMGKFTVALCTGVRGLQNPQKRGTH